MLTPFGQFGRTYRNLKRYREIAGILIRYGFSDFIKQTKIDKYLNLGRNFFSRTKPDNLVSFSRYELIRMAIEELGPAFIKLGQIMSNRPDILPFEFIHELEKLQSSVPPFSSQEAETVIIEELGKPASEIFNYFESYDSGSASIAQVHKAELHTGEKVVIKIQRPGIKKIIDTDLEIMRDLASLVEKHMPALKLFQPLAIVEEFSKTIKKEIDFNIEKSFIGIFTKNFENDEHIYIPKVYKEYSTKRVLTLEYIDGIKITDNERLSKEGIDKKQIANLLSDLILKQILDHGFFHADPHPGNILIIDKSRICFIDFGMMGFILPQHIEYLTDMILGYASNDIRKICRTALKMTINKPVVNHELFELRVSELLQQFSYLPLKDIDISELVSKYLNLLIEFNLQGPPTLFLLAKTLVTIEGVARKLDPDFEMHEKIKPYAKKLLKDRMSPVKFLKKSYSSLNELVELMTDLPLEAREIIDQLKNGRLTISYEHKGLEPMLKKHDQISNRISFAIILAAIIIGSSLIAMSHIPPLWNGIPLIGILGFLSAGMMGFWLLISILRSGKF